ncbi:3-phosphoshikimate 1-carboxyvinyltransferase [bacterium]|nr:3-phosphoshikimate 1-carboxyvinyltransferase [bacterium]
MRSGGPTPDGARRKEAILDHDACILLPRARGPLRGTVDVPGDKSVSHRAALFGLLANGPCRARGWLASADTLASLAAVRTLGAAVVHEGDTITVTPPPARPQGDFDIDCGNSGTTARLLCGLLAGWLPAGAAVTLRGDASLSGRPMNRVVEPLRRMGADIAFLGTDGRLPLRVTGAPLTGVHHDLPVPSAQVKSALLLAGLGAAGVTSLSGAGTSRDHTELLLHTMGVPCAPAAPGPELAVTGGARPGAFDIRVPADPSTAAFFHVAAALVPGSDVLTPNLSLNPTRIGALQVLRRAGAVVAVERPSGPSGGEALGDVRVRSGTLRPFTIGAADIPALVDEIPVLAVLATAAPGVSRITGAAELRVKESDRLALMTRDLVRLGAAVTELPDGLEITGPSALKGGAERPTLLETAGDHRIAMAMAVAALVAEGDSELDDRDCVAVSFPEFFTAWDRILGNGTSDRPF